MGRCLWEEEEENTHAHTHTLNNGEEEMGRGKHSLVMGRGHWECPRGEEEQRRQQ
jgi:hypothetical protein